MEVVFGEVMDNLKLAIEETNAEVTHDLLPKVMADSSQIGRILQNLISNALKFHDGVPPQIDLKVRQEQNEWIFSVTDNGIGIRPQDQQRIFVIFQRLHTFQEYPGSGMGLAVCKRILERHGGRIWVSSEPGAGSTFYFSLPVASGQNANDE